MTTPNDFESELTTEFYRFVATDPHWRNFSFKDLFEMGARWGYERGKAVTFIETTKKKMSEGICIINALGAELVEARAEIERLKYGEQEWMLNCGRAAMQLKELRALAARMAEALTEVSEYSVIGYDDDSEVKKALAAYEAFESEHGQT